MHHLSKSESETATFSPLGLDCLTTGLAELVKIMFSLKKIPGLESLSTSDTYNAEANPFFARSSKASFSYIWLL